LHQPFLSVWLTPADEKFVIDRADWNSEPVPENLRLKAHFSVVWHLFFGTYLLLDRKHGVEIAGLIMRLYFNVSGCIVPVGCIPEAADHAIIAFTLAGPCDAEGRKEFYFLVYSQSLDHTSLSRYSPGFSSIADFHVNRSKMKPIHVYPVSGGKEALVEQYEKLEIEWY
jgi:hypothetical protein